MGTVSTSAKKPKPPPKPKAPPPKAPKKKEGPPSRQGVKHDSVDLARDARTFACLFPKLWVPFHDGGDDECVELGPKPDKTGTEAAVWLVGRWAVRVQFFFAPSPISVEVMEEIVAEMATTAPSDPGPGSAPHVLLRRECAANTGHGEASRPRTDLWDAFSGPTEHGPRGFAERGLGLGAGDLSPAGETLFDLGGTDIVAFATVSARADVVLGDVPSSKASRYVPAIGALLQSLGEDLQRRGRTSAWDAAPRNIGMFASSTVALSFDNSHLDLPLFHTKGTLCKTQKAFNAHRGVARLQVVSSKQGPFADYFSVPGAPRCGCIDFEYVYQLMSFTLLFQCDGDNGGSAGGWQRCHQIFGDDDSPSCECIAYMESIVPKLSTDKTIKAQRVLFPAKNASETKPTKPPTKPPTKKPMVGVAHTRIAFLQVLASLSTERVVKMPEVPPFPPWCTGYGRTFMILHLCESILKQIDGDSVTARFMNSVFDNDSDSDSDRLAFGRFGLCPRALIANVQSGLDGQERLFPSEKDPWVDLHRRFKKRVAQLSSKSVHVTHKNALARNCRRTIAFFPLYAKIMGEKVIAFFENPLAVRVPNENLEREVYMFMCYGLYHHASGYPAAMLLRFAAAISRESTPPPPFPELDLGAGARDSTKAHGVHAVHGHDLWHIPPRFGDSNESRGRVRSILSPATFPPGGGSVNVGSAPAESGASSASAGAAFTSATTATANAIASEEEIAGIFGFYKPEMLPCSFDNPNKRRRTVKRSDVVFMTGSESDDDEV